jgi:hypothetical protein
VSAAEKKLPFAELRETARVALYQWRRSLGQGGAGRCVKTRQLRAGWVAARPAVERRCDGGEALEVEKKLGPSRLSPRGTLILLLQVQRISMYIHGQPF